MLNSPKSPLCHIRSLHSILGGMEKCVVAVSGGVDSMTLALVARRFAGVNMKVFHAESPAVPPLATERVERYAALENWDLTIADAGEFADKRYRENPINRCYYCKTNLYRVISSFSAGKQIVSGTNADDMKDYRPGLAAAKNFGVRHPYVEAGIAKSDVRAIARYFGADDLSELPASPCLSSRVETGIRIESRDLLAIDRIETHVRRSLGAKVVRCRVRRERIEIQLDNQAYSGVNAAVSERLTGEIAQLLDTSRKQLPVTLGRYRMGSAFVGVKA